jgi:hypothetical protein
LNESPAESLARGERSDAQALPPGPETGLGGLARLSRLSIPTFKSAAEVGLSRRSYASAFTGCQKYAKNSVAMDA